MTEQKPNTRQEKAGALYDQFVNMIKLASPEQADRILSDLKLLAAQSGYIKDVHAEMDAITSDKVVILALNNNPLLRNGEHFSRLTDILGHDRVEALDSIVHSLASPEGAYDRLVARIVGAFPHGQHNKIINQLFEHTDMLGIVDNDGRAMYAICSDLRFQLDGEIFTLKDKGIDLKSLELTNPPKISNSAGREF